VQRGKALVFLEPTWAIEPSGRSQVRKAWVLKKNEYVRLLDSITGKVRVHCGEAIVFPEANEKALDGDKLSALDIKVNEYAKILDKATGEIRVVRGPSQVMLGGLEETLEQTKGVVIDEDHAVLVRDKQTGQIRLVTEKQTFVPGPHEKVEEVRELVRLAEHEVMIIKDKDGNFVFKYGGGEKATPDSRSFFLPAYAEVVQMRWSRGRRRETRDLYIERFDCRAQYMSFEFNCRTKDNVELILEGTFFWEVTDLPLMVRTTGDTSGDICNHARSQFIKQLARVDLKEFMDDINSISQRVYSEDLSFYASRGVRVHSLEVTSYQCAEKSTSQVLQKIIQETTNRMNRLSQQESENEVLIFKMQGQIEQEKLKAELLDIQHQHSLTESVAQGKAEAQRVASFMESLQKQLPELSDRVSVWQTLRKKETLAAVSQGGASLYYTPSDVDLSINTSAK
jgi:regulator of protease activity HflC (stomatin/prohibitin superfamily)